MHNEPPVLIWSDGNANAHDAGHNAVVATSLAGQPALTTPAQFSIVSMQ